MDSDSDSDYELLSRPPSVGCAASDASFSSEVIRAAADDACAEPAEAPHRRSPARAAGSAYTVPMIAPTAAANGPRPSPPVVVGAAVDQEPSATEIMPATADAERRKRDVKRATTTKWADAAARTSNACRTNVLDLHLLIASLTMVGVSRLTRS